MRAIGAIVGAARWRTGRETGRLLALASLLALILVLPTAASAANPARIYKSPAGGAAGSGSGQLVAPSGVAADPDNGHVFVADQGNNRVSEFDSFGQFVKAWGWGVADGQAKLETCGPGASPPAATCRQGLAGAGVGQFNNVQGGIAIDSAGNIWVGDLANHRVEKFSPLGEFLLMVGGGVNKGPGHPGNVCSAANVAEGDNCGAGVAGSGVGEFETAAGLGNNLTAGAAGTILVGDKGRIVELAADGSVASQIQLEPAYSSKYVEGIARTTAGSLYLTFAESPFQFPEMDVRKVDATGAVTASILTQSIPTSLALDSEDNLFVALAGEMSGTGDFREVVEYGPAGEALIAPGEGFAPLSALGVATHYYLGLATNVVTGSGASDVYITEQTGRIEGSLSAYGPAPDKWEPPRVAPQIVSQYASAVGQTSAEVSAEINPRFWAGTTYTVEYGTGICTEGGCPQSLPAPAASLGGGIVDVPVATEGIELSGLAPNTIYHFRFTAESSGGGPVTGVGGGEAEGTFRTPIPLALNSNCPNQALRIGAAAALPDCRAYELVSPVDKNGADIYPLINVNSIPLELDQSTPGGEKLAYSDYQAFGDAAGAPYMSQYIATEGEGGWQTHDVTAPQGVSVLSPGHRLELGIWQFTPDLCAANVLQYTDPALALGAVTGFRNAYLRHNCGTEGYESVSNVAPPAGTEGLQYLPAPQGLSSDGRCSIIGASGIGPAHGGEVYESCGGHRTTISLLPNGTAASGARVGTANGIQEPLLKPRIGTVSGAVSADGERVYWSESEGKLYVRVNAGQEPSALSGSKCTQPGRACTEKVSQTVSGANAKFLAASSDGSQAYFAISESGSPLNGNLYVFNVGSGTSQKIASEFIGDVGASVDGSRFVFASREVLTVTPNSAGGSAVAGEPNLYYYDSTLSGARRYQFVATLSGQDAVVENQRGTLSPIASEPFRDVSRMSDSGEQFVFMSTASPTGYDNVGLQSGEPDAEVYLYDASAGGGTGKLTCVSCNPSGQRPAGRELKVEGTPTTWAAAGIPPYQTEFYGGRVVSANGDRVFFDSYESLVVGDQNGPVADVYEWEAPGAGDCVVGGSGYSEADAGCISLISTGKSPVDSEFLDASVDGGNIFFATDQSLVPQDPGQYDIYDAHELGGFPQPPASPAPCVGDACQVEQSPPGSSSAGTVRSGPGNPKGLRPSCAKGRRAVKKHGRWSCVKQTKKSAKKHKGSAKKSKGHAKKKSHKRNHKSRRTER
jgi:DNA-binding beta-propeller fold protein YncE